MRFVRSDLASECAARQSGEGVRVCEVTCEGCRVLRVRVCDKRAAHAIGRPMGHYATLECGDFCEMGEKEEQDVCRALSVEMAEMAKRMCQKRMGLAVLVVGLGNAELTPDSLGPLTVSHLLVTRKPPSEGNVGEAKGGIAAVIPGISAKTGLETIEFLRGIIREVTPDLVVIVDALAAREPERVGSTVQLSDTGVTPGSGVGARNTALCDKTLGVPVIALGVPTVVDSATLVADALESVGYGDLGEEVKSVLRRRRRYFVTPREIDLLVRRASILLAAAIERSFAGDILCD